MKAMKHESGTESATKNGIGTTHKEHQDNRYQYKADHNCIDQVVKC